MKRDYEEPTLPMRPKQGKVKLNGSGIITLIMLAVVAVLALLIIKDMKTENTSGQMTVTDVFTGANTSVSYATPTPTPGLRPESEGEGLLPVFYSAYTNESKVALTLQGVSGEMDEILGICATYGAKVTFFATVGEINSYPDLWREVILSGHEIECRAFTEMSFSDMDAEAAAYQLDGFTQSLKELIGEDYTPHFVRTGFLPDDSNKDLHAMLIERGFVGVARWALFQPNSFSQVEPGQIIALDLSSYSAASVGNVIKILTENGYALKTMNELFDYPENIISEEAENPA